MVIDLLPNWNLYFHSPIWDLAFNFLLSIDPSIKEGEYPIQDKDAFARVLGYSTIQRETARFEAHRHYVDIQTTLIGAEGIEWAPIKALTISHPFDPEGDVEFYSTPSKELARVDVFPGTFVVLFPEDAHMTQLAVGMSEHIKKVVIKVKYDLVMSLRC